MRFLASDFGAWLESGVERAIRAAFGVDFAFVHAASTGSLYGRAAGDTSMLLAVPDSRSDEQ